MINKVKMRKSGGRNDAQIKKQSGPSGAGPDNYDGRERMRAEQPPDPTPETSGPGKRITGGGT